MATGKFHVTDSGDVRPCNATARPCRYGESEHYTSREEGRKAVEAKLQEEQGALAAPATKAPAKTSAPLEVPAPFDPTKLKSALPAARAPKPAPVPSGPTENRLVTYHGPSGDIKGAVYNAKGEIVEVSFDDEYYSSEKNLWEDTNEDLIDDRRQIIDEYTARKKPGQIEQEVAAFRREGEERTSHVAVARNAKAFAAQFQKGEYSTTTGRVNLLVRRLEADGSIGNFYQTERIEGRLRESAKHPGLLYLETRDQEVIPLYDTTSDTNLCNRFVGLEKIRNPNAPLRRY